MDPLSKFWVYFLKLRPLSESFVILVIRVHEVVHAWSYDAFIKIEVRLQFVFCQKDRIAIFLFKYSICLLHFLFCKFILSTANTHPYKVVNFSLRKIIQICIQERRRTIACLYSEHTSFCTLKPVGQLISDKNYTFVCIELYFVQILVFISWWSSILRQQRSFGFQIEILSAWCIVIWNLWNTLFVLFSLFYFLLCHFIRECHS